MDLNQNTITLTPPDYQGSIFAKNPVSAEPLLGAGAKMNGGCIGWDWLQFSATSNIEQTLQGLQGLFRWEQRDGGTEHFRQSYDIYCRTAVSDFDQEDLYEKCAFLEMEPRVGFLSPDLCLIKIENKYCYQGKPSDFIKLLCEEIGVTFKNYTRLDAFIDVQKIDYQGGTCQDLMLDFASHKVIMKGKSMTTHHERQKITGITWGKRVSGISVTMYNKTKHMRKQGNNKAWVAELWASAGFDTNVDTYRIEFSGKKNLYDLIDTESGENFGNHSQIEYIDNLKSYVKYCYNKHFQIAINTPGVRFSRMERLNVLDINKTYVKAIRLTEKEKSTNYIKAQIKNTITDALFYQGKGDRILASNLFEYVENLVNRYYLNDWFHKKFAHLELHNLNLTIFDIVASQISDQARHKYIKQAANLN